MYVLPDDLRDELKKPLGPVVQGELGDHLGDGPLATVGDVVTQATLDQDLAPQVMVVDGITQRTEEHPGIETDLPVTRFTVTNPAARITTGLWHAIAQAYAAHEHALIEVDGEEDLATLPAIVHAPPGAQVIYGQPDEGAVIVTVDQTTRRRALQLLANMEVV